ncbi:MAG: DUF1501 domain-containing protein [Gammaproteobacteria bacterium]|nr:DUF1501 domain-containing protein [Gammaproteobacteria bacterium]
MANHNAINITEKDILVCIFQRGAADGLNALVPYGDNDYYNKRPTMSVPQPGANNGAIDLDGFFGLHPALAPLKPIYDIGDLALIHATGVPHRSRSHFTAQELVERGLTNKLGPNTGWLGRHLALNTKPSSSAFRVVSISGNVPVTLTGADDPLAFSEISSFGFDQGVINTGYPEVLTNLFRNPLPFSNTAQAALSAVDELASANPGIIPPDNGAAYPVTTLGKQLQQVGQLIKSTLPVEVICLDSNGWDHHENLPTFIQQSLTELAGAISAFHSDMGTRMQNITVLINTEFGRRVSQNASLGADHGTGSLAYVMGGGINGGQVFSNWPGLSDQNLEMNEDLKITTDLRSVQAELLTKRLGGTNMNTVFPGFTYTPAGIFN